MIHNYSTSEYIFCPQIYRVIQKVNGHFMPLRNCLRYDKLTIKTNCK